MNNNFLRALKLYLKAAANPFTIGFAILFSGGMLALFIIDPEPVGSKDHSSMLGTIQMGKIGFFLMAMIGNLKIYQNKFYTSCCCGKAVYTAAPIVTGLAMTLIYDIVFAAVAAVNLGITGLSYVLIIDSVGSSLLIFAAAFYGKKKLTWFFVIPYFLFLTAPIAIRKSGIIDGISELSLGASAVITVGVYAVSVGISLVVVNAWWKKSDRFTMPNKFAANAIGGQ